MAVTDAGLYLLGQNDGDAVIAEALKNKPSRSEPPKPYKGTKRNRGRYLDVRETKGGLVACMGEGPMPGDPDCEDTCYGEMCVSPDSGIVSVVGQWAPDMVVYTQDKFRE